MKTPTIAVWLVASCITFGLACQPGTPDPPAASSGGRAGPGGGGGSTGPGSDDSGAGTCSTLDLSGALITQEYVGESIPPIIGGTIASGTYLLTAANVYTGNTGNAGPTGATYQATLTFNDDDYTDLELTGDEDGGVSTTSASSGTFSTSGSVLTLIQGCPAVGTAATYDYSVDGNTLHLTATTATNDEFVFTLQ